MLPRNLVARPHPLRPVNNLHPLLLMAVLPQLVIHRPNQVRLRRVTRMLMLRTGKPPGTQLRLALTEANRASYGYDVNSAEFKAWQAQQYAQYYAQQGYPAADGSAPAPPPSDAAPPPPPPS